MSPDNENPITLESLTPNLMVADMARTLDFYSEVLGFNMVMSNPQEAPFEWAMLNRGGAAIMFQTRESIESETSYFKGREIGGTLGFFIQMTGVEELFEQVRERAEVMRELQTMFYGMREFSIVDPDGYMLTFAEQAQGED